MAMHQLNVSGVLNYKAFKFSESDDMYFFTNPLTFLHYFIQIQ
jgi:hypothetical protein